MDGQPSDELLEKAIASARKKMEVKVSDMLEIWTIGFQTVCSKMIAFDQFTRQRKAAQDVW